jgi:hypothetical protein
MTALHLLIQFNPPADDPEAPPFPGAPAVRPHQSVAQTLAWLRGADERVGLLLRADGRAEGETAAADLVETCALLGRVPPLLLLLCGPAPEIPGFLGDLLGSEFGRSALPVPAEVVAAFLHAADLPIDTLAASLQRLWTEALAVCRHDRANIVRRLREVIRTTDPGVTAQYLMAYGKNLLTLLRKTREALVERARICLLLGDAVQAELDGLLVRSEVLLERAIEDPTVAALAEFGVTEDLLARQLGSSGAGAPGREV